jgi:hypothetical protein
MHMEIFLLAGHFLDGVCTGPQSHVIGHQVTHLRRDTHVSSYLHWYVPQRQVGPALVPPISQMQCYTAGYTALEYTGLVPTEIASGS